MKRKISAKIKGYQTVDGAGVHLVRVLGNETIKTFDPILMLDSFDTNNPEDYIKGFPMHPHRGIETITYLSKGRMIHRDSLGNEEEIESGEVQWMNSGSGILHEEMIPESEGMLGVQLWLNLPQKDKYTSPSYHSIKNSEIKEIPIENGKLRLLAGQYENYQGFKGKYLPFNYYDIHLNKEANFNIKVNKEESIMLFTLKNEIKINDEIIPEKTAIKLIDGDEISFESLNDKTQILYISSHALNESVAWAGPIVMNSQNELRQAFNELRAGTFVKEGAHYED